MISNFFKRIFVVLFLTAYCFTPSIQIFAEELTPQSETEELSDEELSEYNRKRDEERVKVENKPIKVKDFELVKEE